MLKQKNSYIFVGPTLHGCSKEILMKCSSIQLPPVKRGDIDFLVNNRHVGKIIIVDGTFHSYPAVGHAEILRALETGWEVWGLSSMGAIRACELNIYGMKGFGTVYEKYINDPSFTDDEVTLIHQADYPYSPLTEPLVHIREFIETLVRDQYLKPKESNLIIDELKSMWYGYRTLNKLTKMLFGYISLNQKEKILRAISDFNRYRLKTLDLVRFLEIQLLEDAISCKLL